MESRSLHETMSSAMLTQMIVLLITQQTLSRPAETVDKESIGQSNSHVLFVHADGSDVSRYIDSRGISQPSEQTFSATAGSDAEDVKPAPHYYQSRGFLSNLFGSSGAAEIQKPNKTEAESKKPNNPGPGKQSATIVSATTYPEGSKPTTGVKPTLGQEKPTETTSQDNFAESQPPSAQPSPPGSLNEEFLSSLFDLPLVAGSQNKPNKPLFGSSPDISTTFASYMNGFMKPPHSILPPPPPMAFGGVFDDLESHYDELESHFGELENSFEGLGSPFGALGGPFGSGTSLTPLIIVPSSSLF